MYKETADFIKQELLKFKDKPYSPIVKDSIFHSIKSVIYNHFQSNNSEYIKFDLDIDQHGNLDIKPLNIFTLGVLKGVYLHHLVNEVEGEFKDTDGIIYGIKLSGGIPQSYYILPTPIEYVKIEATINLDKK